MKKPVNMMIEYEHDTVSGLRTVLRWVFAGAAIALAWVFHGWTLGVPLLVLFLMRGTE